MAGKASSVLEPYKMMSNTVISEFKDSAVKFLK